MPAPASHDQAVPSTGILRYSKRDWLRFGLGMGLVYGLSLFQFHGQMSVVPVAPIVAGIFLLVPDGMFVPDWLLHVAALLPVASVFLASRYLFGWLIVVCFWMLAVIVTVRVLDGMAHS